MITAKGSSERRLYAAFIVLTALVSVLVYVNSVNNAFTFKTVGAIEGNESIRSLANVPSFFLNPDTSKPAPLVRTTFAVDYSVWGERAVGFRLTNILLHALASILVFLLAAVFIDRRWALFAALVFAVHPAHTEPVTGIAGRGEILSTVLMLLSFRLFLVRGSKGALSISVFVFLLALLSSETAVVLPFLLALYALYFMDKRGVLRAIPFFATLILYFILYFSAGRDYLQGVAPYTQFITVLKVFGIYLKLLVFPVALNAYYDFPPVASIFSFGTVVPLQALVLVLAAAALSYRFSKALSFALLFTLIAFFPALHVLPHRTLMSESFLYLPSVGFCLLVGTVFQLTSSRLQRTGGRRAVTATAAAALAILVIFSVITVQRNTVWKDNYSLLTDTVIKSPGSILIRYNMGVAYDEKGMLEEALKEYEKAIELNPSFANAYYNVAAVHARRGEVETGLKALKWAVARGFKDAELLGSDPDLDNLRGEPGFMEILLYIEEGKPEGHF